MSRFHPCSLFAIVACLTLSTAVQAAPPGSQLPDTVSRTASGAVGAIDQAVAGATDAAAHPELQAVDPAALRTMREAIAQELAAQKAASTPQVIVVQPQAQAPAGVAVAAPPTVGAQSSGVAAVLKAVPIETWGLILGVLALVVLQLLGARGAAVRSKIDTWIDLAYYAAEAAARAAGPDSPVNKVTVALDAFHRGLLGEGVKATATDVAKAQAAWTAKAEAEHVETEIRARAAAQAAAEAKPSGAGAVLEAARG